MKLKTQYVLGASIGFILPNAIAVNALIKGKQLSDNKLSMLGAMTILGSGLLVTAHIRLVSRTFKKTVTK